MILKTLEPVSFGRFQDRKFELARGVNLIEAPNEAGKSTLAAFISGMLYGFFLRDRKTRGYSEAYQRYLPWDNPGRYIGAMTLEHEGAAYRLERNFLRGADSVRLLDALTGRDVSDLMYYNPALRIREPGRSFLGISQTAFEGTLYVPQQAVRTGDALGAELSDRIDALSRSDAGGVSAAGALRWLDERRAEIGTPRQGASPLGALHRRLDALNAELEDSLRRRAVAARDADRAQAIRSEIEALEQAQREDGAALSRARAQARRKRAEAAREYRARVAELEERLEALSCYGGLDEALLEAALSGARLERQLSAQADEIARTLNDLDGEIGSARRRALETGLDDQACALSDAIERAEMRASLLEGELAARREAEAEARRALPDAKPAAEPHRAAALMARFEALPDAKPAGRLAVLGALLLALSLSGLIHPIGYAPALPGALLLALGIARTRQFKRVFLAKALILEELGARSPDDFPALREALEARARAEGALAAATEASRGARAALAGAAEELDGLLGRAGAPSAEAFFGALAAREEALGEARALQIRRAALLERLTAARDQAAVHGRLVRRAMAETGAEDECDAPEWLSKCLRGLREYKETLRALDGARKLLAECLGPDGYEALLESALPEPGQPPERGECREGGCTGCPPAGTVPPGGGAAEPPQTAEALERRVDLRAERIRALAREMDACVARRDALEDACRAPAEIQGEIPLIEEEIGALTRKMEAINAARARIERAADEMRRRLSPALGRAVAQIASRVTEGRYEKLYLDPSLALRAEASGQVVSPDQLSGGAADAMYLALRLGLIEFLMDGRECPVVMDDSFAQLDDNRAERMLATAADSLAARGQLLLMTCQPRTRRILEKLGVAHRAVEL